MGQLDEHWIRRHRLSVADYYRMGEAGLFAPDARVELIDGAIIDMAPIGSMHAWIVTELTKRLLKAVPADCVVRVQNPLRLDQHSEPQPDLVLAAPSADGYASRHPTAADALLVIEVSDTTVRYDIEMKVPLYARHGVAAVWVFDLQARSLRTWSGPVSGGYTRASAIAGADIRLLELPGVPDRFVDATGLL